MVNVAVGMIRVASRMDRVISFGLMVLEGDFGSEVTAVPYVAWESAMNVFAAFCSRFLPTKSQQRLCTTIAGCNAFGPYTMAIRIPQVDRWCT